MPVKNPGLFLILIIAPLTSGQAAATLPAPFTASYTLWSNHLLVGRVKRSFEIHSNNHYLFKSESRATGLFTLFYNDQIIEQSIGRFKNSQIQPLEYSYHHTGGRKPHTVTVHFDWERGRIIHQVDDRLSYITLVPYLLDKLLYQLLIMRDLKRGERELQYWFIDGNRIKTYQFTYLGEETITTPLGQLQTLKLERRKAGNKHVTTLWCAPALDYLPVRVDNQEENGRVTSAVIEKIVNLTPN